MQLTFRNQGFFDIKMTRSKDSNKIGQYQKSYHDTMYFYEFQIIAEFEIKYKFT